MAAGDTRVGSTPASTDCRRMLGDIEVQYWSAVVRDGPELSYGLCADVRGTPPPSEHTFLPPSY